MLVNLDTKVVFLFEQGYMFLNPVVRRANDQRWILRSPRSASTMLPIKRILKLSVLFSC